MVAFMKTVVFRVVVPCCLVEVHRRFGCDSCYSHLATIAVTKQHTLLKHLWISTGIQSALTQKRAVLINGSQFCGTEALRDFPEYNLRLWLPFEPISSWRIGIQITKDYNNELQSWDPGVNFVLFIHSLILRFRVFARSKFKVVTSPYLSIRNFYL
jgi:hypothetical protein